MAASSARSASVRKPGQFRESGDADVQTVEDRLLRLRDSDGGLERAKTRRQRTECFDRPLILRLVLAAALEGDLGVGPAERGIEDAGLHLQRGWRLVERPAIQLPGLPRSKAFLKLFGELGRIGSRLERERRQVSGELMMAMTVSRRAAPSRIDHQRTEHADDPHHVAEDLALVPPLRGLVAPLREAEVERAREELLAAVQPARLQQLLGANHAERVEELGADDVLAAFAAM